MSFTRRFLAPLLVAAVFSASAFAHEGDPVVIRAGDLSIRKSELEKAIASLPPEYQEYARGPGRRSFADDFLRMKLLSAQAEKDGMDKDPEVVAQLDMLRQNILATAQLKKLEATLVVSEDDLRKAYEANAAAYEQAKARHILIAFDGSPAAQADKPKLTDEQAKQKAEKIRDSLTKGDSFEEVAKKESDDVGSGASGGSLGEFSKGQMVPEFEAAVFAAKAGELTPVVRTQFGYHVIRVDEFTKVPFEKARAALESTAKQKAMEAKLASLHGSNETTFDEAYFGTAGK